MFYGFCRCNSRLIICKQGGQCGLGGHGEPEEWLRCKEGACIKLNTICEHMEVHLNLGEGVEVKEKK